MSQSLKAEDPLAKGASVMASGVAWKVPMVGRLTCQWMLERLAGVHLPEVVLVVRVQLELGGEACSRPHLGVEQLA